MDLTFSRAILTVLISLLVSARVGSGLAQDLDFRGTVQWRSAVETGSSDFSVHEVLLKPEMTFSVSQDVSIKLLGQARVDYEDRLEAGDSNAYASSRSTLNSRWFLNDRTDLELREAYADVYAGEWFLRLGKQQVVWGQADGLRVLDKVNPFSFREFILGDMEDRRIPLWMVNAERSIGSTLLQLLWIPDHTYNDFPEEGTFAIRSPSLLPILPLQHTGPIHLAPASRPNRILRDDDFGARLTGFSSGWDWSLNALYAYDDQQAVSYQTRSDNTLVVRRDYHRSLLIGASASNAFGKTTLRTEVGYSTRRHFSVRESNGEDGIAPSGEFSGVVGLDYQLNGDMLISGQLFLSYLEDSKSDFVRERRGTDLSLLLKRDLMNDILQLEGLFLYNVDDGDVMSQLQVSYKFSDQITLAAGVDHFHGNRRGKFGQFDDADRVTFSVEWDF